MVNNDPYYKNPIRTPAKPTLLCVQPFLPQINCTFAMHCTHQNKKIHKQTKKLHKNNPHPLLRLPIIYIHLSFLRLLPCVMSVSEETITFKENIYVLPKVLQNFTKNIQQQLYLSSYLLNDEPYCFVIFLSDSHLQPAHRHNVTIHSFILTTYLKYYTATKFIHKMKAGAKKTTENIKASLQQSAKVLR